MDDYSSYDTYLGRPRYFNQIDIPDFWHIKGDNTGAKVYINGKKALPSSLEYNEDDNLEKEYYKIYS